MKATKCVAGLMLAALFVSLGMVSPAFAREVITIKKANGGSYNITAYNTSTKSHYYVTGSIDSDDSRAIVPYGYACTITVTLGRAVGDRNLYEKQDPLHPIYEVRKKSTYLLELVRTGSGYSGGFNSIPGNILPGGDDGDGKRHPPPGQ